MYDPSLLVRSVIFGRLDFEENTFQTRRQLDWLRCIALLFAALQNKKDLASVANDEAQLLGLAQDDPFNLLWFIWLCNIPVKFLCKICCFESNDTEENYQISACPQCNQSCMGPRGVSIHQAKFCQFRPEALKQQQEANKALPKAQKKQRAAKRQGQVSLVCPHCNTGFQWRDSFVKHFKCRC